MSEKLGNALEQWLEQFSSLLGEVCGVLRQEAEKIGFEGEILIALVPDTAIYCMQRDPGSGLDTLTGQWVKDNGEKQGNLWVHEDGRFYAEYDLALVHPQNGRLFVESVTAWGTRDKMKSEAKVIRMVG